MITGDTASRWQHLQLSQTFYIFNGNKGVGSLYIIAPIQAGFWDDDSGLKKDGQVLFKSGGKTFFGGYTNLRQVIGRLNRLA